MRTVLDRYALIAPSSAIGVSQLAVSPIADPARTPSASMVPPWPDLELTAQVSLLAAAAYVNIFRMRSDDTFEADASLRCK
jgi:hypothetical protein